MSNMPNLEAKLKKAEERKKSKQIRKRGRSPLSEGEQNILSAKLIDRMNEGAGNRELIGIIKEYYEKTCNRDLATSSYYEIIGRAKALWLHNTNLPSLENYKREQLIKSELLEEEIKTTSRRDIVDKAKVIVDNWKYRDNIVGMNQDNGIQIAIGISTDKKKVIDALEVEDDNTSTTLQEDK